MTDTRYQAWEDARADHEDDNLSWEYRDEEYTHDEELVLPEETVEQARAAQRIVLPRTLLQSMPVEWQEQFVEIAYGLPDDDDDYQIRVLRADGTEIVDPVPHYNRGRTHMEPNLEAFA